MLSTLRRVLLLFGPKFKTGQYPPIHGNKAAIENNSRTRPRRAPDGRYGSFASIRYVRSMSGYGIIPEVRDVWRCRLKASVQT
jgi:hypothetical protein